jgi:hypothetical protein
MLRIKSEAGLSLQDNGLVPDLNQSALKLFMQIIPALRVIKLKCWRPGARFRGWPYCIRARYFGFESETRSV